MRRRVHLGRAAPAIVVAIAVGLAGCGSSSTTTVGGDGGHTGSPASSSQSATSGPSATSGRSATSGPSATSRPPSTATTSTGSSPTTTTTAPGAPGGPSGPPTVPLHVSPTDGHPDSTISFSFVAPKTGAGGSTMRSSWSLSVTGPRGSGCVSVRAQPLSAPVAGQEVQVSLGPEQLGGRWCVGTYVARVDELERPVCAAGEMCPQFIRLVAVAGPARFEIAR